MWKPAELGDCMRLELHLVEDGEWRLLVSALDSVSWEATILLVSVATWTRDVSQHTDTTGKKFGCLFASLFTLSTYILHYSLVISILWIAKFTSMFSLV